MADKPPVENDFLMHIAQTLGRSGPPTSLGSLPPEIRHSIARLVYDDADLPKIFIDRATAAKLHVAQCPDVNAAADAIVLLMTQNSLKSAVITRCQPFEETQLVTRLRDAGVDARYWDESSLDATYEVDVGITDVWTAVAETGSIVVKSSVAHGRAVSLVPPYHFAVVRKSQIVPDLIDLMARIKEQGSGAGVVIITGPSKTADIEMNLVTGVHGPGEVHVFVID